MDVKTDRKCTLVNAEVGFQSRRPQQENKSRIETQSLRLSIIEGSSASVDQPGILTSHQKREDDQRGLLNPAFTVELDR